MPDISERLVDAQERAAPGELPYISKSRVMSWLKNPEHFRLKYLEGLRPDETFEMRRGTALHETFEDYYHNAYAYTEATETLPEFDELETLLPDYRRWADFVAPYVGNFLRFENRRLQAADHIDEWLPVGIEDEVWMEPDDESHPEWMGIADAVYPAAAVPEIEDDDGVVIVDFKTGKVPDEKYRDEGIFVELEYYRMVFESKYDIAGLGVYYPREDEFILSPRRPEYWQKVYEAVDEMVRAVEAYEPPEHFETKPGPLCKWGFSDDEQSDYYGICPCSWGVPANNPETFTDYLNEGKPAAEIADLMGTTTDAVSYWKYKFDAAGKV